jgi:ABC-type nitrate/sulfonate/bicarbonate transport system substrate-binding protein
VRPNLLFLIGLPGTELIERASMSKETLGQEKQSAPLGTPLRLIQFRAGYNLPVHVAMETGGFARYGLDLELEYIPGSNYLIEALKDGRFEIAHTAADDLVADVETETGHSDLFLFMGIFSGLLSLVGSPENSDIHSLQGKSLGVDAKTSGFVFLLEKKLRSAGFGPGDYTLQEAGGLERRFRALLEGKFAATILSPPYVEEALEAGCHLLAGPDELIPVYQATCGIARRSWAKKNHDLLVRYIRAYVEATRWCFDPKNRRACLDLLAKHNNIGRSSAQKTLDALLDPKNGLYPNAELNLPGIATVLELRAEMGYLKRPLPLPEKYFDLSYYRSAVSSIR